VHQEIAQLGGVQDVCVEKDDERGHNLDPDLLIVGGQLGEGSAALCVGFALVCHQ
jgi:hypothetical protein